jgi:hypothetical protein
MKKILDIILLLILSIVFFNCKKDKIQLVNLDGYIIGFDPCAINNHYRIGYVIVSTDLKDTLLTYNISDEAYKMPASVFLNPLDTLYKFPEINFANYAESPFFPIESRYDYNITITYKVAEEDELVYYLCSGNLLFLNFNQIIVMSISK